MNKKMNLIAVCSVEVKTFQSHTHEISMQLPKHQQNKPGKHTIAFNHVITEFKNISRRKKFESDWIN